MCNIGILKTITLTAVATAAVIIVPVVLDARFGSVAIQLAVHGLFSS